MKRRTFKQKRGLDDGINEVIFVPAHAKKCYIRPIVSYPVKDCIRQIPKFGTHLFFEHRNIPIDKIYLFGV